MEELKTQGCLGNPEILDVRPPFSNFDFVEDRFGGECVPIRRIFSQARMGGFSTLVIEEIPSVGLSKEDDTDLIEAGLKPINRPLYRLTFFKSIFANAVDIQNQSNEDFLGYAILKAVPTGNRFRWIVFESVTNPARHDNNFYHATREYKVSSHNKIFSIKGNIYCQQNDLTNVCAHVALRTCISMVEGFNDFSYREMNRILKAKGFPHGVGEPLSIVQIKTVLDSLGIKYSDQWYPLTGEQPNVPFQKYLYASVESGYPALLGFTFGGASGHIIPVIGHTFNEDTWVPNAETSYFTIGKDTRYVPSELWVSSYICHDDNFGSHFCLPRQYMSKNSELFVIAIKPKQVKYDAINAEAIAVDYLYSIAVNMIPNEVNRWLRRLREAILIKSGWVVLRTIFMSGKEYIDHLRGSKGWQDEIIDPKVLDVLENGLKGYYWVVEISLPELFPANRRKLGEIVLNAEVELSKELDLSTYVLARLPGQFYFFGLDENSKIFVQKRDCGIKTHSRVFSE